MVTGRTDGDPPFVVAGTCLKHAGREGGQEPVAVPRAASRCRADASTKQTEGASYG